MPHINIKISKSDMILPRSKINKKEKKERKNVYIKESQIKYILQKCGGDGNFSPYLSKMIDLSIALLKDQIVQELTDKEINSFIKSQLLDRQTQQLKERKVLEYEAVFEQMADKLKYFVPDIEKAIELRIPLMEHYSLFDINKIKPRQLELLARIVRANNIVDSFDYAVTSKDLAVLEISGKNPASLEWYSKILLLTISYFKSNWQLKEFNKSISGTDIRITIETGTSVEESRQKIIEFFNDFEMMINDQRDNNGIWNALKDHFNAVIDKNYLEQILRKDENSPQIVPYKSVIDSIRKPDMNHTISNVFNFYEKINLISFITFDKVNKKKIAFFPNLSIVEGMLKNTFDYLNIKNKMEKENNYLIFTFS